MRFAIFALLMTACGGGGSPPSPSPPAGTIDQLKAKNEKNLADYNAATAARKGWPSDTDCDGLVWAGVACLGGANVDIGLAEQAPGELHRRPAASGECYPNGSSSKISRDGAALYGACQLALENGDALKRVADYADAHGGYLGDPHSLDLTFFGIELPKIYGKAIEKLGGNDPDADLPAIELVGPKDYQQHIGTQEILFSIAAQGATTGWERALLQVLAWVDPHDPLIQAALGTVTGDCAVAAKLLLDPGTPVPSYVRGDQAALFAEAWWLESAHLVLSHCLKDAT